MKTIAHSPSRLPTNQETISFESASIAVHVQISPASTGAALARATFFCLQWTKAHTFYVQMVCNRIFASQPKTINEEDVKSTLVSILEENDATYFSYKNILPESQWRLLSAIAKEGTVSSPTSGTFIHKHRLGSSSAVLKSVKALLDKEFIFQENLDAKKVLAVYDIFFSRWLEKFKMN